MKGSLIDVIRVRYGRFSPYTQRYIVQLGILIVLVAVGIGAAIVGAGGYFVGLLLFAGIFRLIVYGRSVGDGYSNKLTLSPLPQQGKAEQKQEEINPLTATVVGQTAMGRVVAIDDVARQAGCYVLGVQGVGKSSMLEGMIYQDICKGYPVIVLDPHGDLIDHTLAQMPDSRLKDVSLLSIEDTEYPFGLNLFGVGPGASGIEQVQARNRIKHVFEKCFSDTKELGTWLEKYVNNIAPVFFANASAGYGMIDIPTFLSNEDFRERLVSKARLLIKEFWLQEYAAMSPSVRRSQTESLATRINRFRTSPIVANIIGQSTTTIDFRRAIENKEIIFIKLPIKTLKDDATLIGTILVAQIHAAIFSFVDMPLEKRPSFSLYVDEFQHFATSDFAEMFTEGRKFGARVTVAHQFRGQLPKYLASANMTAETQIAFRITREDAPEIAPMYVAQDRADNIDIAPDPVKQLAQYASDHPKYPEVRLFVDLYLRPMQAIRKGKRVEVRAGYPDWVEDPEPYLNDLLYRVETQKDYTLRIPLDVVNGFAARRFWKAWNRQKDHSADSLFWGGGKKYEVAELLSADLLFPSDLLKMPPNTGMDDLYQFLYLLRRVMVYLAQDPIGERQGLSNSDVAQQIMNLPRRRALVKIGNDISEIKTLDIPQSVAPTVLDRRRFLVVRQTRQKYCRPAADVEREIERRLGITPAGAKQHTQGQNTQPGTAAPNNTTAPQGGNRFTELDDDV